jgi:hypothetical protein
MTKLRHKGWSLKITFHLSRYKMENKKTKFQIDIHNFRTLI